MPTALSALPFSPGRSVLDPALPFVFLDTDTMSSARASPTLSAPPEQAAAAAAAGDTAPAPAVARDEGGQVNGPEAKLAVVAVRALLAYGCLHARSDVGVCTPFRAQSRLLRRLLEAAGPVGEIATGAGRVDVTAEGEGQVAIPTGDSGGGADGGRNSCSCDDGEGSADEVEVQTVDRYQGREKRVVVFSFAKASHEGRRGDILQVLRRGRLACI